MTIVTTPPAFPAQPLAGGARADENIQEAMPSRISGLGLETSDGRYFCFDQPLCRANREGSLEWMQPGTTDRPELVWRDHPYGDEHSVRLTVTNTTWAPLPIRRLVVWHEYIPLGPAGKLPAFYQPGWQTWSQAGSAFPPVQEPAPVKAVRLPGPPAGRYAGSYLFPSVTAITRDKAARVWGFVTAFAQTGLIEFDPQTQILQAAAYVDDINLAPGESLASEELWVAQAPDLSLALTRYGARLAERMGAVADPTRELWWCTWYERFAKIDAAFVLANLEWITRRRPDLPVAGILIDQGHEIHMGDWLDSDPEKFPGGLPPVIAAVHAAGLQFGLWLAPLFFSARSTIYRDHPEWAVRDETGAPLVAKVLEGIEHYGLDTTHPGARAWLATMLEEAVGLGVDLFKFDYLYAGALRGQRHNPNLTSVQAYRQGMEIINAVLQRHPGVRTLGCGAPLAASVGLFGLMRTATDTVPYWPQPGDERYNKDGTQSGQSLTLQSLVSRSWTRDALWSPDSDAFLLRAHDNQLTLPEVYTQAILYWLNERFMTIGDDLTRLEPERLGIYAWLYPALGSWVQVAGCDDQHRPDVFLYQPEGRGRLLVLVNWADQARDLTAPALERDYHLVDTLRGEYLGRLGQGSRLTRRLLPHASQVIRLVEMASFPQVVGTNLHIAGGLAEIQAETWDEATGTLSVVFQCDGDHQGQVLVFVPAGYHLVTPGLKAQDGLLSFPLHLAHGQPITVSLCFERRG